MVVLVYFEPVSIHVPPALSKKCLDCPDWAIIIQDLGNEALRGGKCAICHEVETCYRHISSTERVRKYSCTFTQPQYISMGFNSQ